MVPRTVLSRSGPITVNTVRPVNTVQPRTTMNNAGPLKNVIKNAYSTARRPFNNITAGNNSNFTKKVNIVKGTRVNTTRPKAVLSVDKGNKGNAVKASATKWVFRNKKDERGIVIKNKARLVAQGYTQEEGINYDEVFALVARTKVIRLFLAYALFKDFVVYQMDVKSAFLYGKIEEEVYVYQPPGFEDPDFP
ncbi:copia protein [Tanacetum coccineum]